MRMLSRISIAMLIIACMASVGTPVGADSTLETSPESAELPQFNIRPVGDYEHQWFANTIEAGQSVDLTARIHNAGDTQATLRTYATNATNPANGGFSAATEEDEPTGATLWLDYPAETFVSQPGDEREVNFSISVPAGTPPGEYFAALVVQTAEPLGISGTDMLNQIIRSTISVEITVPGEMTSGFALDDPMVSTSGEQWVLDVPITNIGTARIRPEGELVVARPDGEEVSTTRVEMGSVYGGNTTSVRAVLPGHLPLGEYRVSLDLLDEATGGRDVIEDVPVTLAEPEVEEPEIFVVEQASVSPNGEVLQYADVAATITNNGPSIPTANVMLDVQRDGEVVESYPLAESWALPQGTVEFDQRYIPVDGWESGAYTFDLVIFAVSGGSETVIARVEIADEIAVP